MKKIVSLLMVFGVSFLGFSQEVNTGEIHGNFDLNLQTYQEDELIGATAADEVILNNAYLNLNYTKGNFATGLRYESYLNALADYDPEFKGNGIPYRYATYSIDGLEVTVGNYYEQLGSGLIFRSYEEKGLIKPYRTGGGTRRYSQGDIDKLIQIQDLSQRGINLDGIKIIYEMRDKIEELQNKIISLENEISNQKIDSKTKEKEIHQSYKNEIVKKTEKTIRRTP